MTLYTESWAYSSTHDEKWKKTTTDKIHIMKNWKRRWKICSIDSSVFVMLSVYDEAGVLTDARIAVRLFRHTLFEFYGQWKCNEINTHECWFLSSRQLSFGIHLRFLSHFYSRSWCSATVCQILNFSCCISIRSLSERRAQKSHLKFIETDQQFWCCSKFNLTGCHTV